MKQILVNCTSSENRVAILEDDKLARIFIERQSTRRLIGSILKGRVSNIIPGMQCAFVDIGTDRDLFLPLSDIQLDSPEDYYSRDEDQDCNEIEDEDPFQELTKLDPEILNKISITDVLKNGQEITVQVIKEPIGNKGPRGTTFLTLPGRYLVLMPTSNHVGISRRIEDPIEVSRLHEIGTIIKPNNMGFILRTEAEGKSKQDIEQDLLFLLNLWESVQNEEICSPTPSLIHSESYLLLKVVRDHFNSSVDDFIIDSKEEYDKIMSVCKFLPQELKDVIRHTTEPIFTQYSIEEEIHKAIDKRVPFPSGGYAIIEETEALISIDVNTGSFLGTSNLEETVYQTNLEAAVEIARQLKLRNLGGIIIIDFIDMISPDHKDQVYQTLMDEIKLDKTKYNIQPISELGILQMTRQRIGRTLSYHLLETCPYCKGNGRITSKDYICNKIHSELRRLCKSRKNSSVVLATCHPEVASILLERDQSKFKQLEEETNTSIFIRGDASFHYEKYRFS
ncbi:Rne/Rng family ribonuclease [bacterium]|nr:Rne/Rng family ribonuclease [bacterium]